MRYLDFPASHKVTMLCMTEQAERLNQRWFHTPPVLDNKKRVVLQHFLNAVRPLAMVRLGGFEPPAPRVGEPWHWADWWIVMRFGGSWVVVVYKNRRVEKVMVVGFCGGFGREWSKGGQDGERLVYKWPKDCSFLSRDNSPCDNRLGGF